MKKAIFTLLLFNVPLSYIFAQELPVVNFGAGSVFVLNTKTSIARRYNISGYNLIVEKPFRILHKKVHFLSIHPGVGYTKLNENFESSGLGRYYQYAISASAASIYSKILFNSKMKLKDNYTLYAGADFGAYFWSQIYDERNGSMARYENGKSLFHSGFMGILFGVRPYLPADVKFIPSFEISYYPNYVDLNIGKRNALNLSILLGFGSKKELPE